jgi:HAE1 family hydrophobic/amphiphilic exporter-1
MLSSLRGINLDQVVGERPNLWPTAVARSVYHDAKTFATTWFRGNRKWAAIFLLPLMLVFLSVKFVVGLVFELIGRIFFATFLLLVWIWLRGLGSLVAFAFQAVTRVPIRLTDAALGSLGSVYPRFIHWGLAHPTSISVLALLCLAATVGLFVSLDSELLPEVHQGEFTIEATLPVGTPLEETEAVLTPIEAAILDEKEHIESLLLTLGFDPATSQRSDEGEHTARFKVILDSSDPRIEQVVVKRLRAKLVDIPDLNARVVRPVLFSFRTPIEVEVHGDDLIELRQMSERVRSLLATMPQLADVETTQRAGAPEVQIQYDRDQLTRYGLNIAAVAQQVRDAVKGSEATLYNLGDRRIPIVVRFVEQDRSSVEQVGDFMVNPGSERPIPLSSVAEIKLAEGPSEVRRVDGRRVALINANLASGSLGAAVETIEDDLNQIDWPSNMTFYISGQNQEWQNSRASLLLALGLSIFLVYVIMAAQFESLIQPLVIMLTIPLAFFGTVVALLTLDISLSIVVFLGMIMLAGIVVNNAIVLVDYINTLRARGLDRAEAIVTAGSVRLRPILMTTATTVLGLLPMALGLGDGAEIRTPMAIAVISGLLVSTLLTLLVIPSVYSILDRARERFFGPAMRTRVAEVVES